MARIYVLALPKMNFFGKLYSKPASRILLLGSILLEALRAKNKSKNNTENTGKKKTNKTQVGAQGFLTLFPK